MDDVQKPTLGNNTGTIPPTPPPSVQAGGIGGKELEGGDGNIGLELPLTDIGKEIDLSPEVKASGVTLRPTTIPLPRAVSSLGVKPIGNNAPKATGQTVVLPLTQVQIAQGLQQSILTSWRWLSAWCVKRLKQMRIMPSKK